MAKNKNSDNFHKDTPQIFEDHETNMDGSEKNAPPYQKNRKIGPTKTKD